LRTKPPLSGGCVKFVSFRISILARRIMEKLAGVNPVEDHIRSGVATLEPIRFRWLICYGVAWLVGAMAGGATFVASTVAKESPGVFWTVLVVSGISTLVAIGISSSQGSKLHEEFNQWRSEGVKLLDRSATFSSSSGIDKSDFDESGLNSAYYNTYSSWNSLEVGGIRSSALSVKHIYTEKYTETESYTDTDGQSKTRQVTKEREVVVPIFDGLMVIMPAKLPHESTVMLRHRDAGVPKDLHRLTVASPFLAKHYAVGASEPFAGHRALTPTLMESLWDYDQQFEYTTGYSYKSGLLYIKIPKYWLIFGDLPGKWTAVTTDKLDRVLNACGTSIAFLKSTATKLVPT
jgi:hypothetical protein